MKIRSLIALAASALAAPVFAADVQVSGQITSDVTWSANNNYILNGYVFVTNGATLTIEPGTVVKGQVSSGSGAAALVITRNSKIMADGTADNPIIFTSALDELNGNLSAADTGLWGGLVILGNAVVNSRANGETAATPVQDQIEGFSVSSDQTALITFGGTNDDDNSGVLRYVSVRHGGAVIGVGNEINGVTFGGVGRGTTVEYVEVFANKDDGFEWFGGAVNAKHLVASFCNDECFDIDTGFRGNLQFLFSIQKDIGTDRGDKAIEWDGATVSGVTPKGDVTISNYTAIGIGSSTKPDGSAGGSNQMLSLGDYPTVKLYNSVFVNFAAGIQIFTDIGDIAPDIKGNVFWSHVAANNTAAALTVANGVSYIGDYFTAATNNNAIVDPQLRGISYDVLTNGLDPRPAAGSPLLSGTIEPLTGDFFTATTYRGAFEGSLWIAGWTKLAELGMLPINTEDPGEGGEERADDVSVTINVVRNSASKPVNVSTRGFVGTGDQVLTAGFVINGSQAQSVLIRVAGPTLGQAPFNLPGVLSAAQVRVFRPSVSSTEPVDVSRVVRTQSVALSAEVGAFPLAEGAGDATIVAVLVPGAYTVEVSGVDGATGIAIVEVYEID